MQRSSVVKLADDGNAVRSPATTAEVGLSPKDLQPLVCTAEAAHLCFLHSSPVKKIDTSLSVVTIKRESKRVTVPSHDAEEAKIRVKSCAVLEDVIDTAPAGSAALQMEARPVFQVLRVAKREYCFVKDTFF